MTDAPTRGRLWWTTIVLGMASYLDSASIAGTGTALVLYQKDLGLADDDIGRMSAVLTFAIAVGALTGGRLGDRFGRRRVFTVTMIVLVAGAVLAATAVAPPMLYLGLALLGIATGADLPVSLAMIGELAPDERRGRMIGLTQVLWVAGIVASIVLGIIFGGSGQLGARIIYGHILVVALLVLVARTGIPESARWREAADTRTTELRSGAAGASDIGALRRLFSSRYLVPVIALALFFGIANISANTNGQFQTFLYVRVGGVDVSTASALGLVSIGIGVLSLLSFMRLVDHPRARRVMLWIAAALALAAFLLPAIAGVSVATILISTILYSLGGGIIGEPMYKVWSQELIPVLFRSSVQGITIAFTRVLAAVVALFTPAIIAIGAVQLYWFLVGTTIVALAIGLLWLTRIPRADHEVGIGSSAAPTRESRE